MNLWSRLFRSEEEEKEIKTLSYYESAIWKRVRKDYGLRNEPYPAFPIRSHRDVMWRSGDKLYFAPKKMNDIVEIERYLLSDIKRFFVNPREHNEICMELQSSIHPLGNGTPLKFRSNSLHYFQELIPEKEYKFSQKVMQLGNEKTTTSSTRLGDLKDVQSGAEFEEYLTILFQILGFHAENTKLSGDQGIDVLLSKGKRRYGVQAKFYQQPVSNSAVQQVISGREFFKLDKGIVVTNSSFTASAVQLAEKTEIRLINGEELDKLIKIAKSGKISNFLL